MTRSERKGVGLGLLEKYGLTVKAVLFVESRCCNNPNVLSQKIENK